MLCWCWEGIHSFFLCVLFDFSLSVFQLSKGLCNMTILMNSPGCGYFSLQKYTGGSCQRDLLMNGYSFSVCLDSVQPRQCADWNPSTLLQQLIPPLKDEQYSLGTLFHNLSVKWQGFLMLTTRLHHPSFCECYVHSFLLTAAFPVSEILEKDAKASLPTFHRGKTQLAFRGLLCLPYIFTSACICSMLQENETNKRSTYQICYIVKSALDEK